MEEKFYTSNIEFKHEWTPCFFSASWMIRVFINNVIFSESEGKDMAWDQHEIEGWIRTFLLKNWTELAKMDVNVNQEYEKWGGKLF